MADDGPSEVRLVLRALPRQPGDSPGVVRLKLILKELLRRWGWRCVSIEDLNHEAGSPQERPAGEAAC
jgi:hypothetical protein